MADSVVGTRVSSEAPALAAASQRSPTAIWRGGGLGRGLLFRELAGLMLACPKPVTFGETEKAVLGSGGVGRTEVSALLAEPGLFSCSALSTALVITARTWCHNRQSRGDLTLSKSVLLEKDLYKQMGVCSPATLLHSCSTLLSTLREGVEGLGRGQGLLFAEHL